MENQNLENNTQVGQKTNGALVGSIIIVAILIIGGIYLFSNTQKQKSEDTVLPPSQQEVGSEDSVEGSDVELSSSDEISDIEKDLDATSNMELDSGIE